MHDVRDGDSGKDARWRDKDQQILCAADAVFFSRGYAEGSMHAIAMEAGVSKQTLYHHYRSKPELFRAVVEARVRCLLQQLSDEVVDDRPPKQALTALGRRFVEMVVAPSSVAMHRALVNEVPRQPGLGRSVYEHGPEEAVRILAAYFRKQARAGALKIDKPELAAEQFYGMALGHCQLRALFCIDGETSPGDLGTRVDAAVDAFLAAYGGAG